MSPSHSDGGPAFPCPSFHEDPQGSWLKGFPGISIRDYFAGQALSSMNCMSLSQQETAEPKRVFKEAAINAYTYADAMLVERERKRENV
jgi:hypothetical protein